MVAISALKVGDVVYSPERVKEGNTKLTKLVHYSVRITEVSEDYVMASWNGNTPQRFGHRIVSKWKRTKPAPKVKEPAPAPPPAFLTALAEVPERTMKDDLRDILAALGDDE